MSIKLVDSAVPMNESGYPVARAKHIWFDDDATLQEKFDNKELGGGDSSVTLTQEDYEALSEEEKLNGLYYTYDTKRIYKNGIQYGASEPIPLTMEEYKALKEAGAIDEKQEYLVEADAEGILLEASDIGYSNAVSNLPCTTVQGAIDKVAEKVDGFIDDTSSSTTNTYSSAKITTILGGLQFGVDENGNYGYIKVGADTVTPFKSGVIELFTGTESFKIGTFTPSSAQAITTVSTGFKPKIVIIYLIVGDPAIKAFGLKTEGTEEVLLRENGNYSIGEKLTITLNDNGFNFQQTLTSVLTGSVIYLAIS